MSPIIYTHVSPRCKCPVLMLTTCVTSARSLSSRSFMQSNPLSISRFLLQQILVTMVLQTGSKTPNITSRNNTILPSVSTYQRSSCLSQRISQPQERFCQLNLLQVSLVMGTTWSKRTESSAVAKDDSTFALGGSNGSLGAVACTSLAT